jgi:hypothetical protein
LKGSIKKNNLGLVEKSIFWLMFTIFSISIISYLLILCNEGTLEFSFSSNGFTNFTTIFSFPIKCISAAVALFSLWAVVHNLNRTRIAFVFSQLSSELNKCEEEIKDILSITFPVQDVRNLLSSNLTHPRKSEVCHHFSMISNPTLKIDEIVPHLMRFGVREEHAIYRTYTQNLTLRLQRYVIALLEIHNLSDEHYFVRYYASKYTTVMKELYHFGAEIDLEVIHSAVQLASMEFKYKFDYSKVNGSRSNEIENSFYSEMGVQKK